MPDEDPNKPGKIPETKSLFQVVNEKLSSGTLQILFQMEIDSNGKTTFTVFKGKSKTLVGGKDDEADDKTDDKKD